MDLDVSSNKSSSIIRVGGDRKSPKPELVYISQILILYVIIICSLVNLSMDRGERALWISLLSLCIGAFLPAPKLKGGHRNSVEPILFKSPNSNKDYITNDNRSDDIGSSHPLTNIESGDGET